MLNTDTDIIAALAAAPRVTGAFVKLACGCMETLHGAFAVGDVVECPNGCANVSHRDAYQTTVLDMIEMDILL